MSDVIDFIQSNISGFDLIVFLIIAYSMAQSAAKGFMMSLLSFSKWILALVITIILVPKFNPWVQDYIESKFIADIGLGIFIYIIALFVIINIGKAIGKAVTYSGLGSVDKTFGLIFGIFKGYVICVCIFSLLNWFYPHKNWPLKTEDTYSFEIIYKGSVFLVKEFPNSKDYYEQTEEQIEKI
jgi:membrane protein required for colicin V production|tara:strand:- start:307 stop:855 length:549 start_codon:yes stop_codon:yes gene_type:complete